MVRPLIVAGLLELARPRLRSARWVDRINRGPLGPTRRVYPRPGSKLRRCKKNRRPAGTTRPGSVHLPTNATVSHASDGPPVVRSHDSTDRAAVSQAPHSRLAFIPTVRRIEQAVCQVDCSSFRRPADTHKLLSQNDLRRSPPRRTGVGHGMFWGMNCWGG